MPTVEIAVESSVPDNTAFTVLTALRELGYGDLERVERSTVYALKLAGRSMPAAECAQALKRAEVVFNPNIQRLAYVSGSNAGDPEAVVSDKEDQTESLCTLLVDRFGVRGLERVERATAWRLYDRAGPANAKRLDWACEILLANPYSQTYLVRNRPHYTYL